MNTVASLLSTACIFCFIITEGQDRSKDTKRMRGALSQGAAKAG